jgi:hypothetical protein
MPGSLSLDDTAAVAGAGGAVVFSAGTQAWKFAAIKGYATNGSGNSQGDIVFYTRRAQADATLSEAMRITAAGQVGIGTSTPTAGSGLDVEAAASSGQIIWGNGTGKGALYADASNVGIGSYTNNPLIFWTNNGAPQMTLTTAGNFGINCTPLQRFHVHLAANANIVMWNSSAGATIETNNDAGSTDVGMCIAAAPLKLSTTNSGVSIGNAGPFTPAYLLHLALDSAGKPSTNAWTVVSDIRTKQNVAPLEGGLDVIRRMPRPIVGEYNGLGGTPKGTRVVSFDLEELRKILPHTVGSHRGKLREEDEDETDLLDFNSHEILMHLVLAVQQLAEKN